MNYLTLQSGFYSTLISLIAFSVSFFSLQKASAQITPDNSLGAESSVVNQLNQLKSLIEGGAVRGENLFHSFQEFNVGNGQSVYFVNPDGVNNILTRVTGDNISQILGTLGVNGNANLFLINPNGFIFGNGAKLDLNGSFTATTGDIQLGEDGVFSATDIEGSSLLSVKPEALFANFQGQIENRASLVVRDGEKIILMADKVVNRGNLIAPEGLVKLQGNEVVISGNSIVDVSGDEGAGNIAIQGTDEVNIGENVSLRADALVSGDGGAIEITSQEKVEFLGYISATGDNPGTVTIDAPTVINHGVIDLGVEEGEGSEDGTEEQNACCKTDSVGFASDKEKEQETAHRVPEVSADLEEIAAQEQTQQSMVAVKGDRSADGISNPPLQPDTTLGSENTQIEAIDENNAKVIGGAERGANLFHSFREFDIEPDKGVYFANPVGIDNILARVTGDRISDILGTLGVLGNANLFLLNPNGILFGSNASLDLRGSFIGTTANSFTFADGSEFSATNPSTPPSLTVKMQQPIGLKFAGIEGAITNAGDLVVAFGQTLSLSGSNVVSTGNLTAPGGRVELWGTESVALLENATINVSAPTDGGTVLIGGNFQGRGTVLNSQRTYVGDNVTINADALTEGNGGKVIVWADEVTGFYGNITARGGVNSGNGGLVEVSGKEHLIFRGQVDTSAINGLPGTLLLDPTNIIIADGSGDEAGDGTDTFAGNNSEIVGSILTAPLSELEDTAPTTIYESELEGLSGNTNIILQATNDITLQDLSDDGLELAAGTGVIALSADADGDGIGDFVMEDNVNDTIFTNGRNIVISGANLTIGNINTSQLTVGDAGELIETAQSVSDSPGGTLESISGNISDIGDVDLFQIYLTGEGTFSASTVNPETAIDTQLFLFDANGLGVYANDDRGGCNCFQSTLPAGDVLTPTEPGVYYLGISTFLVNPVSSAGEIFPSSFIAGFEAIKAPIGDGGLLPLSGWIGTSIEGSYTINLTGVEAPESTITESLPRDSGSITLNASGNVNINGLIETSLNSGNGGNVEIKANDVVLTNSAQILSIAKGEGDGGAIIIDTGSLFLQDGSLIETRTLGRGNGGSISITAKDIIDISGENVQGFDNGIRSIVSTGATGDSGGITINTSSLFLKDGALVDATTFGGGNAGDISITAKDIIDISGEDSQGFPSSILSLNLFATGNSGDITINTRSLSLKDGAFLDTNIAEQGQGNSGTISITAKEKINLSGQSSQGFVSFIRSLVEPEATGNSGGIIINTNSLSLEDGAFVDTTTFGEGNSGNISINTGSLSLTDGAQVRASTSGIGDAGAVTITATDTITLEGENSLGSSSAIFSLINPEAAGNSGGITINTGSLSLTNGALVNASTRGLGNAGAISVTATDTITLEGENSLGINSGIFSQVNLGAQGNAGGITIDTGSLSLTDGAVVSASTQAVGNTGAISINATDTITLTGESSQGIISGIFSQVNSDAQGTAMGITIDTGSLSINDGAQVSASTQAVGNAGAISINANDTITLTGESSQGIISGIFSRVNPDAQGNAGGITIETGSLSINDGALVSASTFAVGNAGGINITATDAITLEGKSSQGIISGIFSQVNPGAQGNAGDIIINTGSLSLKDGSRVSATTFGVGDAGVISITVTDTITLSGKDSQGLGSSIISQVSSQAEGNAKGISITTNSLLLTDGATVSARTRGAGEAGNVVITANTLEATSGSQFRTNTTTNFDAGDITLEIRDNLLLSGTDSGLFAQTQGEGTAGNIIINTSQLTIDQGASISAFTEATGNGGIINVNASQALLLTDKSKLTVESSDVGTAGNIVINTPLLTIGENAQLSATATETSTSSQAGDITLNVSQLNIAGELGIFAETQSTADAGSLAIQPFNTPNLNLNFSANGFISARTTSIGDGGSITITAPKTINIRGDGSITAETSGSGQAGSINIETQNLTIADGVIITTSTESSGNAGKITLNTTESLNLTNQAQITSEVKTGATGSSEGITINTPLLILSDNSEISAATDGEGKAGSILIDAEESVTIDSSSLLNVETNSVGEAGNIDITTNTLTIGENAELSARTTEQATGKAGNITLNANQLNISGELGIFAETEGIAPAGNLTINPHNTSNLEISLTNQGTISASTFGSGDGGDISITAPDTINLIGDGSIKVEASSSGNAGSIFIGSNQLNISEGVEISASTSGIGDSGDITLDAANLNLNNATISALTTGTGNPGSILITNEENNANQVSLTNSTISTEIQANGEATQPANININTDKLTLDASKITASTNANRDAGNITIPSAQEISLINNSEISALTTGQGKAGNIDFDIDNEINLDSGSKLNVETQGGGDAGDIDITADTITVGENAELSARTTEQATGKAGNITLNANQVNISGELGIFAETEGIAPAGNLTINPNGDNPNLNIDFTAEGIISASTLASGEGGDIIITAPDMINLSGDGSIKVEASGSGNAGSILIDSNQLNISEGVEISASTSGIGDSGDITFDAANLNLNNANISALTTGTGNPGSILITNGENNANNVSLTNATISTEILADGIATNPANITINTDKLTLDASTITASTSANRDAGNITIPSAQEISLTNNSEISALTTGQGKAGNIDFDIENEINLDSGSKLNVETQAGGDAGDIDITANTITIGENAELSARTTEQATGKAGNISLNTNQLNISGELGIFAETEGIAPAGNLTINPNGDNPNLNITFTEQGQISASTSSSGDGGNIEITAPDTINLSGDGSIKVEASGSGNAGNILIDSNQLNISEGVEISASTSGIGDSGDITLDAANLNLNNATISALTTGVGNPGSILITNDENNANQVSLTNSTISTEIQANGEATQPANITINTDKLTLDASKITASSNANRDAGNISIRDAQQISLVNNSEIRALTTGEGKAGSIDFNIENEINLESGSQLNVETQGGGDAGDIDITADTITIGENAELSARTTEQATGKAGKITLKANQVNISGELGIFAETEGIAPAGNLTINPNGDNPNLNITFTEQGQISASTSGSGDGGNIEITAPDTINLSGDGSIKVEASGSGNAGNILIDSNQLNISEGVEISASTSGIGDSGDITLDAVNLNLNNATISALTTGDFNPGRIEITKDGNNAHQVTITNSEISTEIQADGEATQPANIIIDTDNLSLDNSTITASTSANRDAGNITITDAEQISLINNSEITASTTASGNAGNINLDANLINLNLAQINAFTNATGNAGSITLAHQDENADNITLIDSRISTEIQPQGDANTLSNITIKTDKLTSENSTITASTSGKGSAGNITIPKAQQINLTNSRIIATTSGEGDTGEIKLTATNKINLAQGSQISSSVETGGIGNSEQINLNTPLLSLTDGSNISAATAGEGNAGTISIANAIEVFLEGESSISTAIEASGIATQPSNININTQRLTLSNDSKITASTFGQGNTGEIDLNATESINLSNGSEISSAVEVGSVGNSEQVTLNTPLLSLTGSSNISAATAGEGNAGTISIPNAIEVFLDGSSSISTAILSTGIATLPSNININTQRLTLSNNGGITASTFGVGNTGKIDLTATESINLSSGSEISSAVEVGGVGNSEQITLNTPLLSLTGGSNISAATEGVGNAGNITIPKAQQINLTNSRIIATTSGEGDTGEIKLTATNKINLAQGSQISSSVETGGIGNSEQINLNTPLLSLTDGSNISAATEGVGNAGTISIPNAIEVFLGGSSSISTAILSTGIATLPSNININTQRLTLSNNGGITASTFGVGNTGKIDLNATESINLSNGSEISSAVEAGGVGNSEQIILHTPLLSLTGGSNISAATAGEGNAGTISIPNAIEVFLDGSSSISTAILSTGIATLPSNININTQRLTLSNNSEITASTAGKGNAGNITIPNAHQINLTNSRIIATTSGEGDTGEINLRATNKINLADESDISSSVETGGIGNSRQITLNTPLLSLNGGSNISAATEGVGNAGTISIPNAIEVFLGGSSSISTAILSTGIATLPSNININIQRLTLSNNGGITASTFGVGNTGKIDLTATESIKLSSGSEISSAVEVGGVGNSEQIILHTPLLSLTGGSNISAATAGEGNAGTISIPNAMEVFLDGNSSISTAILSTGIANLPSNININTQRLTLSNNSEITASTAGKGNAGNITIPNAQEINLTNSRIIATTSGEGDTGEINLTATEKINLADGSKISSSVETGGIGNSRQITLNTPQLQLTNNAQISAATAGIGNAGQITIPDANNVFLDKNSTISTAILPGGVAKQPANITINTNTLTLDNSAEITASSAGEGEGGNITIKTTIPLTLNNQARITSALDETGIGKGGNITINAPSLFLDNQSEINASTFGKGDGGFVRLIVDRQINLDRSSAIATAVEPTAIGIGGQIEIDSQQVNLDHQSQLRASTLGQGNADSITIRANTVELINGSKIRTETDSKFDAGNISLTLTESLFISDNDSGLFANTEVNSTGNGGSITVNSPLVNLENHATIAVSSLGEGIGGDIEITANTLNLDNSDITAQTLSTDGGNITLNILESFTLVLSNSSNITATAGTAQAGGDGGNIVINSPSILSIPSNPFNTITANAFEGEGGNIEITTNAIFGREFLIIDASSQLGLDGEVNINDPDVEPTKGLIIIEANFVDAESLIAQNPCAVENFQLAGGSSFVVVGKGGLPTQSTDLLTNNIILTPWVELTTEVPLSSLSLEGEMSLSAEKEKTSLLFSIYCRVKN